MALGDTTFRSKMVDNVPTKPDSADTGPRAALQTNVDVPFTDYASQNNHPFAVDYYQLGNTWEDPDGGFYKEVSIIDGYLKSLVDQGEISNTVEAVREKLKSIERLNDIKKEHRTTYKIAATAAYIKFIQETDDIKNKMKKYGYSQ